MALKAPSYIVGAGTIIGAPIKYRWNNDVALELYAAKDQNIKLYRAIDEANFKAKMSFGAAITEWVIWRLTGYVDLTDAFHRIEAAWASAIDPLYVKTLYFKLSRGIHDTEPAKGPLEIGLALLGEINGRYTSGSIYLAAPVVNQAMLARHVMPQKKVFEDWLSDTIRRLASIFPRGVKYDRKTGTYNASHEKPVPRESFEPQFTYTDVAAEKAVSDFLKGLDFKQNPYLRSPEEMKALGFSGTPYTL